MQDVYVRTGPNGVDAASHESLQPDTKAEWWDSDIQVGRLHDATLKVMIPGDTWPP